MELEAIFQPPGKVARFPTDAMCSSAHPNWARRGRRRRRRRRREEVEPLIAYSSNDKRVEEGLEEEEKPRSSWYEIWEK